MLVYLINEASLYRLVPQTAQPYIALIPYQLLHIDPKLGMYLALNSGGEGEEGVASLTSTSKHTGRHARSL